MSTIRLFGQHIVTVSREEFDRRLDQLAAKLEELGERLGVPIQIDKKNTWWLQPRAPAGHSDGGQWTAEDGGGGSTSRSQSRFGHWLRTGRDSLTGQSTPSMVLPSSPTLAQAPAGAWQDPYPASRISPAFREAIAAREARGLPDGGYGAYNPNTRARGRYQMTPQALAEVGITNDQRPYPWNPDNSYRVRTPEDFLANPSVQERALDDYLSAIEGRLAINGAANQIGQRIQGVSGQTIEVTLSGLVAAGHREGARTVREYLEFVQSHGWQNSRAALNRLPRKIRERYLHIETRLREFQHVSYRP